MNAITVTTAAGKKSQFASLDDAIAYSRKHARSSITKKCVSVIARGTANERRVASDLDLYYSAGCGWVSIP